MIVMGVTLVYHHNDADGLAAAYVHKMYMEKQRKVPKDQVWHFAYDYDMDEPSMSFEGADIVILDFSFPRATIERMQKEAKRFILIDHHKTAAENLEGLPNCIIEQGVAASHLALRHFFGIDFENLDKPAYKADELVYIKFWFLPYVEDRDVWNNKLPFTKEVNAYIHSFPLDLAGYSMLASQTLGDARRAGGEILQSQSMQIERLIENAYWGNFAGYYVPFNNSPVYQSELGNRLSDGEPFAVVYWDKPGNIREYSLRSAKNGEDVEAIARMFGGGGHVHAAGFTRPKEEDVSAAR
jgi:oligoribonuclease NrnB/cAMP/cGMP phosphodiesterase (DHH superfamily)